MNNYLKRFLALLLTGAMLCCFVCCDRNNDQASVSSDGKSSVPVSSTLTVSDPYADNTSSLPSTSYDTVTSSEAETSSRTETSSKVEASSRDEASSIPSTSSKEQNSSRVESSQTSSSVTSSKEDSVWYKDIVGREIAANNWKTVEFTHSGLGFSVILTVPKDWVLTETEDSVYSISRNQRIIGSVTCAAPTIPDKRHEYLLTAKNGININYSIFENNDNGTAFSHSMSFSYTADTEIKRVTFNIDYAELSKSAVTKMTSEIKLIKPNSNIRGDFSAFNGSNLHRVLVLGNSFIGSSQIIQHFNQMCNAAGRDYNLISGWASFIQNNSEQDQNSIYYTELRNKQYSAVFLCGFYSDKGIDGLKNLINICKETNTLLVIFPAHNEVQSIIATATLQHPNVAYVGWKAEIDAFIENGVAYSDMCVNDTHKHTTHLGGYVGAHMMYRALFGQIPPKTTGTTNCSYNYIKQKLGNYVTTGEIPRNFAVDQVIHFD